MRFVDFFAGIGGIRLGLEQAGHECVGFCEYDKYARQSYKAIHDTEGEWESHDVRTVNPYDVPRAELWCFGFPCQDISVAGKQKGLQNGERSGLFYEIMRLLAGTKKEDRPQWLLIENVKNLLSIGNGFDFLRMLVELEQVGYCCEWQVLNSKDFGVPQNRERVFIVGHLGTQCRGKVFPVSGTDGENPCKLQEVNLHESTDKFCLPINTEKDGTSRTIKAQYYKNSAANLIRTDSLGCTGACAIDLTANNPKITENVRCLKARYTAGVTNFSGDNSGILVAPVITPDREEKQQNGRRIKEAGEPMFTLTAQDRHGIAILNDNIRIRKLTPKECWRLQGFPDEYFDKAKAAGVSNTQLYKQAGNGVTVNVAHAIGLRLAEIEKVENNT